MHFYCIGLMPGVSCAGINEYQLRRPLASIRCRKKAFFCKSLSRRFLCSFSPTFSGKRNLGGNRHSRASINLDNLIEATRIAQISKPADKGRITAHMAMCFIREPKMVINAFAAHLSRLSESL
ncbi:hypothetical protein FKM82_030875 [Ascaphus truei]